MVSTTVPAAQDAYDRGLLMLYAFNVGAAREAFMDAAALDPQCAMAFYGQALAEVTDINRTTDIMGLRRGASAIARAQSASEASSDERALVAALAKRFNLNVLEEQRVKAYESAMRDYASSHPDDADGLVETAFAIWQADENLHSTVGREIGLDLDRALALNPSQLGAHNLRIHFEEDSGTPADALADADALYRTTYDLGESHFVHMAGHIYDRVGNYIAMTAANEIAVANDDAYFKLGDGPGQKYMQSYHRHDLEFVVYGLTTMGRNAEARAAIEHAGADIRALTLLRLHDWHGVLATGPSNNLALGIANARLGNFAAAEAALFSLTKEPENAFAETSQAMLRAVIADGKGDDIEALRQYGIAYAQNRGTLGDPKLFWSIPIGESYGAALIRTKHFAEAERVFAAELARFPNDPRLVFGQAQARAGQGKSSGNDRNAFVRFWRGDKPLNLGNLG